VAVVMVMRVVKDGDHEFKSVSENGRVSQPAAIPSLAGV
jgi:hypothetical protein